MACTNGGCGFVVRSFIEVRNSRRQIYKKKCSSFMWQRKFDETHKAWYWEDGSGLMKWEQENEEEGGEDLSSRLSFALNPLSCAQESNFSKRCAVQRAESARLFSDLNPLEAAPPPREVEEVVVLGAPPPPPPPSPAPLDSLAWACRLCTFSNPWLERTCSMCNASKEPEEDSPPDPNDPLALFHSASPPPQAPKAHSAPSPPSPPSQAPKAHSPPPPPSQAPKAHLAPPPSQASTLLTMYRIVRSKRVSSKLSLRSGLLTTDGCLFIQKMNTSSIESLLILKLYTFSTVENPASGKLVCRLERSTGLGKPVLLVFKSPTDAGLIASHCGGGA